MGKNLDSANIIRLLFLCLRKKMVKYSMGKFYHNSSSRKGHFSKYESKGT